MNQKRFSDSASVYVKLSYDQRSNKFFGKCPLCNSGTAGFSLSDETNTFFCYLCGAKGNRSEFYGRLFKTIPIFGPVADPMMVSIYRKASEYYSNELIERGQTAREYLEMRGMTIETVRDLHLGFAPDRYNGLFQWLSGQYEQEILMKSGLFRESEKGYTYDFFRNRIMFPITNRHGEIIAFGGRIIGDEKPKYLNSPENEMFAKRRQLYLYPYDAQKRDRELIVCEGYMDAIRVRSSGIGDVAAVLGTSITSEHARIISRDYSTVVLCMDSDAAGINATKRSISQLQDNGITVRVMDLLPAKDPDEFIRDFGVEAFMKRKYEAKDAESYLFAHLSPNEIVDLLLKQA